MKVLVMVGFILVVQFICLYWVLRCYLDYPDKRWRFLSILVWTLISIAATALKIVLLIVLPEDTLTRFQVLHWVDQTVAAIGYLSVATMCLCIHDYYKRLNYG